jgi:glycosyltransferase involved in cell wall biosynthesis
MTKVAIFIDGTFIPERDGASTRFAFLTSALASAKVSPVVLHCYRGWSDLTMISRQPFPTYFFRPDVFYGDSALLGRILRNEGAMLLQANDLETMHSLIFPLAEMLGIHAIYEAHYHSSTLAAELGQSLEKVGELDGLQRDVCELSDHIFVFTGEDKYRWTSGSACNSDRISVVPFGVERIHRPEAVSSSRSRLVFLGNIYFEPNRAAVHDLIECVVPRVRKVVPDVECLIVGDISGAVASLCERAGVLVVGEVRDPTPFLRASAVGVAPVRVGTGIRVKILQYLASGLPVVALPNAGEGLEFPSLYVEQDLQAFSDKCIKLLCQRSSFYEDMCATANILESRFCWRHIADIACDLYNTILSVPRRKRHDIISRAHTRPLWLDEVIRKRRFENAKMDVLNNFYYGKAAHGQISTFVS